MPLARLLLSAVALASAFAGPAGASPQAGLAAAVQGAVQLVRGTGAVGRAVASGEPIYLGDEIRTGPSGRLQILLLDQTVFTIGSDSALTIDEFVYDPSGGRGELAATLSKGVFRFVTGNVARRDPESMVVRLPAGTIGIRGTSVVGRSDGSRSTVVLLGPGTGNDAGEPAGQVLVSNAGQGTRLYAPRFATTIPGAGEPPTPAEVASQELLDELAEALSGAPTPRSARAARPPGLPGWLEGIWPDGGRAPARRVAGEETVAPLRLPPDPVGVALAALSPTDERDETTEEVGIEQALARDRLELNVDFTTFEELRAIPTGLASYDSTNVALGPVGGGPGSGSYNLSLAIDFGQAQIFLNDFDGVYDFGQGQGPQSFFHPSSGTLLQSYAGSTGVAIPAIPDLVQQNGDLVSVDAHLHDVAGQVAGELHDQVTITEGASGRALFGEHVAPGVAQ